MFTQIIENFTLHVRFINKIQNTFLSNFIQLKFDNFSVDVCIYQSPIEARYQNETCLRKSQNYHLFVYFTIEFRFLTDISKILQNWNVIHDNDVTE